MKAMLRCLLLSLLTYRQAEALRTGLCYLLYYTGLAHVVGRIVPRGASILIYHSVSDRGSFWNNRVSPERFAAQVAYLAATRRIVTVSRIVEALKRGERIPSDWVAITFDDGYRDNLTTASPILRRHEAVASFFITTDVLEGRQRFFYDEIQALLEGTERGTVSLHLDGRDRIFSWTGIEAREDAILRLSLAIREQPEERRQAILADVRAQLAPDAARELSWQREALYLTVDDTRDLARQGMEIGSHTVSHHDLTELSADELTVEMEDSKASLEATVGVRPMGLSYPFGKKRHVNEAVRTSARETGYAFALTTMFGRVRAGTDPYLLPRIGVWDAPLVRLKVHLMGIRV